MSAVNGVDGPSRCGTVYTAIDWDAGERPSWWFSTSLIWEFTLPTGRRFASSNLEEAVVRLSERLRRSRVSIRRTLFASIPLTAGQDALIDADAVVVTAHHRFPYLRSRVNQLALLEAVLADFRPAIAGDVLAAFATAYGESAEAAARLLDRGDPAFYLGVDLRTLDRWSREYGAYEVQEFVRVERQRLRQQHNGGSLRNQTTRRPDEVHEALVRRNASEIVRFTGYFDAPDFVPENDHEAHALTLHRAVAAAATAEAEEQARVERDRYLIEHVFTEGGSQ